MTNKETIGRVRFFFERATTVHIKTEVLFYNGLIMEIVGEDFIIIKDRVLGEIPVYFSEIEKIEPYKERGLE